MEIPQNIKNGTAIWPSDPTSGNISKETWNTSLKEQKHPYVHCSIIYNCQDMEAAQVSVNRWVDETTRGRYTMEYYSAINKEKILPFANDMDGSGEHYANWN